METNQTQELSFEHCLRLISRNDEALTNMDSFLLGLCMKDLTAGEDQIQGTIDQLREQKKLTEKMELSLEESIESQLHFYKGFELPHHQPEPRIDSSQDVTSKKRKFTMVGYSEEGQGKLAK